MVSHHREKVLTTKMCYKLTKASESHFPCRGNMHTCILSPVQRRPSQGFDKTNLDYTFSYHRHLSRCYVGS